MRPLTVALVAALSPGALASFEMMLIFDSTADTIRRYDPVNRIDLGSFGTGQLGYIYPNELALDPTRPGTVSVMNTSGQLRTFNYSSGILVGNVMTGSSFGASLGLRAAKYMSNGNLLRVSNASSAPQIFNALNGTLISGLQTYNTYTTMDVVPMSDGRFLTLERQDAGGIYEFSIFIRNSVGTYIAGALDYYTSSDQDAQTKLSMLGNSLFALGHGPSFPELNRFTLTGNSLSAPDSVGGAFVSGTAVSNLVFGHQGLGYAIQRGGTTNPRLLQFDSVGNYINSAPALPYSGTLTSMEMVLAPEPGTMAAFGISGVLMAFRKRRTKQ